MGGEEAVHARGEQHVRHLLGIRGDEFRAFFQRRDF